MPLTPAQFEEATRLLRIFFPYATRCRDRMIKERGRFVHYTSAENALKINAKRHLHGGLPRSAARFWRASAVFQFAQTHL